MLSNVLECRDNIVHLQVVEKKPIRSLSKGDPIVLNFSDDNKIHVCEGYVNEVSVKNKNLEIRIDNEQLISNSRIFERFPVSLYATLEWETPKKMVLARKGAAVIKNISLSGMGLTTKEELKKGQKFDMSIYIDERVVKIFGFVAWKKKEGSKFEYGIKTEYPDYIVKNTVNLYLNILKSQQENIFMGNPDGMDML
jgi:hypothetical protein